MDVLLVVPAHTEGIPGATEEYLGVEYLNSYLLNKNLSSKIINGDYYGLTTNQIVNIVRKIRPKVLGFSVMQPAFRQTVNVIKEIKEYLPNTHITLGGHFPTLSSRRILKDMPNIDSIVIGEGEETLYELAFSICHKREWRNIKSIACRGGDTIITNPPRELIKDLDKLPFPTHSLLKEVTANGRLNHANILISRGCYYNCSFCGVPQFYKTQIGAKWRARSAKNVADEIEWIKNNFGINDFDFIDEIFFGPGKKGKQHSISIIEELERRKLNIRFIIDCRVTDIDEEVLKYFKANGLYMVRLGIESMSQLELNKFNKKVTVRQNIKAVELLDKLGIEKRLMLITITPYTTINTIKKTYTFMKKYGKKERYNYLLYRMMVYEGLPIMNLLRNEKRLIEVPYLKGFHSYVLPAEVANFLFLMRQITKMWFNDIDRELSKIKRITARLKGIDVDVGERIEHLEMEINRLYLNFYYRVLKVSDKNLKIMIKKIGAFLDIYYKKLCNIHDNIINFVEQSVPFIKNYRYYNVYPIEIDGELYIMDIKSGTILKKNRDFLTIIELLNENKNINQIRNEIQVKTGKRKLNRSLDDVANCIKQGLIQYSRLQMTNIIEPEILLQTLARKRND